MKTEELNQWLTLLPATEKIRLVKIGRHWDSSDTLDQADKTLNGLLIEGYSVLLSNNGFSAEDTEQLRALRNALEEAGGRRYSVQLQKMVANTKHEDILKEGKKTRKKTISILRGTLGALRKLSGDEVKLSIDSLEGALTKIKRGRANARILADQLELCQKLLAEDGAVRTAATARGGEKLALELTKQIQALRAASSTKQGNRGTARETERMDLLDGLIIESTRSARKASLSAAEETGQKAIAAAFELDCLYRHPRAKPKETIEEPKA